MQNYLHTCGSKCPPWHAQRPKIERISTTTVDVHCHMLTPEVEDLVANEPQKKAEATLFSAVQGAESVKWNAEVMFPAANHKMSTLEERIDDMDRTGVDVQIVSPSPTQYYYWAHHDLAAEIGRTMNEHIAAECARRPNRLRAMGVVALQHDDLAIQQLKFCVQKLGMVGVEVSSLVNGEDLSTPRFRKFWATAEELGCVVFLHPLGTSLGDRLAGHYLSNAVGQPTETTVALAKLLFSGLLDEYPSLRLLTAHGGGYLGSNASRLDHAWRVRPEAQTCKHPPSHYLRKIFFDSVVYDPLVLKNLVKTVGSSQVLAGSDYPYDMGIDDLHGLVRAAGLADEEVVQILGENALKLFELSEIVSA